MTKENKNIWKLIDVDQPDINKRKRLYYVKAFERLLLVSTSGALFFALARNIPIHLQSSTWDPNWEYTLDVFLRYLILIWFLAYFFVSSVNNEYSNARRRCKDVGFDVFQSIAVLAATYFLGFILANHGYGFEDGLKAYRISFVVALLISLSSLCLFNSEQKEILKIRWTCFILSLMAMAVAFCAEINIFSLSVLLVLQGCLWIVWVGYFLVRRDI